MTNKTKNMIISSYLELVKEKGIEKVSVTDIVEKCDISRQTFYYHFDDIKSMIKWAFEYETDIICTNGPSSQKWVEACADYLPFLKKYNDLLQSCINTSYSTYISNLLTQSAYRFSCCFIKQSENASPNSNMQFFLKCASLAFVGLLYGEFQKETPDYIGLMKKIEKVFDKQ